MRRGGLGRGLSALIPGAAEEAGLLEIPVGAIAPNARQPRTGFPDETLEALARSIEEVGVLQPVVVRRTNGGYELVAGERRLRAARLAGLATIPAMIRESDDTESLREALIENVHRKDLGPRVLAEAFEAFRPLYTPGAFAATTPSAEVIAGRFGEGPMWVAEAQGTVVGTASAVARGDGLYVRSVAVLPAARGGGWDRHSWRRWKITRWRRAARACF